jgi:hypothetical protein
MVMIAAPPTAGSRIGAPSTSTDLIGFVGGAFFLIVPILDPQLLRWRGGIQPTW